MQPDDPSPLREMRRKPGRPQLYPFDELQAGECRVIEGKWRHQIAACLSLAERRTGFVFFAFDGPGGVRICRCSAEQEQRHKLLKAERKARRAQKVRIKPCASM